MIFEVDKNVDVDKLFDGWQESLIWSCLQNVMGYVYADSIENPTGAMAMLGDFCFFAGEPCRELVSFKPERCKQNFMIMIPSTKEWADLIIDVYGEKAKEVKRYAIKKEPDVFDKVKLQKIVDNLPVEYELRMMDEDSFNTCREIPWSGDLVSQYENYDMYRELGLGVVILKDGEIVSGASSYSSYNGGIEIEIDTKEPYRRRGLAYVCGAKLILECLKRGWYPSWDAQNLWSVALAQKLGYHFDHEYTAYEIWGY